MSHRCSPVWTGFSGRLSVFTGDRWGRGERQASGVVTDRAAAEEAAETQIQRAVLVRGGCENHSRSTPGLCSVHADRYRCQSTLATIHDANTTRPTELHSSGGALLS